MEVLTQDQPYPDVATTAFVFAYAKGLRPQKCILTQSSC